MKTRIFLFLFIAVLLMNIEQTFGQGVITSVKKTYGIVKLQSKYHSTSAFFVVTAEGGLSYLFSDFKTDKFHGTGRLNLELYFPSQSFLVFGLKGGVNYSRLKAESTLPYNDVGFPYKSVSGISNDLLTFDGKLILATGKGKFIPYVGIGGEYTMPYNPKDYAGNKLYSSNRGAFATIVGEAGLRTFITNDISFNLSANYHVGKVDDLDGKISMKKDSYYTLYAGFSFHIFTNKRIK